MALDSIRVPTLSISEDDRFYTIAAARHIAAEVPGAKLVTWPTGGHIYVGHDAYVTAPRSIRSSRGCERSRAGGSKSAATMVQ